MVEKMTDQKLIEIVAVEVMGWKIISPYGEQIWVPKEIDYLKDRKFTYLPKSIWCPLTNANHRDMVVERMSYFNWSCHIHTPSCTEEIKYNLVQFRTHAPNCQWQPKPDEWGGPFPNSYICSHYPKTTDWVRHESIGHAVCLAALEAVRGAK